MLRSFKTLLRIHKNTFWFANSISVQTVCHRSDPPGFTKKIGFRRHLWSRKTFCLIRTGFFSMSPLNVFSGYTGKKDLVCSLVFCLFCKSGPSQAPVRGGLEMSKSTSSTPDFAQRIPLNFWGSLRYLGPLPQKFRGQIW